MAYKRKTWVQKRDNGQMPHKEVLEKAFADMKAGSTMLVPTPQMVDAYIRCIPEGKEGSLAQMRKDLAAEEGAEYCCPVTSGIFLRIAAEAAWEEMQAGKKAHEVAPFWRIIGPKMPAAQKLTFGKDFLLAMQHKEGIYQ